MFSLVIMRVKGKLVCIQYVFKLQALGHKLGCFLLLHVVEKCPHMQSKLCQDLLNLAKMFYLLPIKLRTLINPSTYPRKSFQPFR